MIWSAVTGHRFRCRADWPVRQSRVQRLEKPKGRLWQLDGDKSPAQSADKSAHSKSERVRLCEKLSQQAGQALSLAADSV